MLSITLGVLADFDERAGRYPDAVSALERVCRRSPRSSV